MTEEKKRSEPLRRQPEPEAPKPGPVKRGTFVIDGHTEVREYRDGPNGPVFTDAK